MQNQAGQSLPNLIDAPEFSLRQAVGGVRGVVESVLPLLVFLGVYLLGSSLFWAVVSAAVLAVGMALIRLLQKQSLTQSLSGLIGVIIGAVWAGLSGRSEDFFALGLWTNAVYAVVLLLTIIFRYPAVGWAIALLRGIGSEWKNLPHFYRRSAYATWMWVGLFSLREAVQLPLYLSGATAWLGSARLIMGLPLFALCAWGNWLVLREITLVHKTAQD